MFAAPKSSTKRSLGAFSGAIFFGIGDYFGNIAGAEGTGFWGTGLDPGEFAAQAVSHGVAGGVIAEMQGGKFGHGFLSAGVSKLVTPGIMAKFDDTIAQGVAVAIVGGTVSEATGGKFANGAATSAMAFAFNQMNNEENITGKADTEDAAVEKGLERSRAMRRMIDDPRRKDHPHFRYANMRGQSIGGLVREVSSGIFNKEYSYTYPSDIDFAYGSGGFNGIHGSGNLVRGFFGGTESISNARALIINIPDGAGFPHGIGISSNFEGIPVYINQGTSNNVLMYQYDTDAGTGTCSVFSGEGASC